MIPRRISASLPTALLEPDDRGRVTILPPPDFAPSHVAAVRRPARTSWYDALATARVQDDAVVRWGDADGKKLSPAERPAFGPRRPEGASVAAGAAAHAAGFKAFFSRPAGAVDLGDMRPPIRAVPRG